MPPVPGRVCSIGAEDMLEYLQYRFGTSTDTRGTRSWLLDGSGTTEKQGVIQGGAVMYQVPVLGPSLFGNEAPRPGHSFKTRSVAFAPHPDMLGAWKVEQGPGASRPVRWRSQELLLKT